jgi:hypothetical protein
MVGAAWADGVTMEFQAINPTARRKPKEKRVGWDFIVGYENRDRKLFPKKLKIFRVMIFSGTKPAPRQSHKRCLPAT